MTIFVSFLVLLYALSLNAATQVAENDFLIGASSLLSLILSVELIIAALIIDLVRSFPRNTNNGIVQPLIGMLANLLVSVFILHIAFQNIPIDMSGNEHRTLNLPFSEHKTTHITDKSLKTLILFKASE